MEVTIKFSEEQTKILKLMSEKQWLKPSQLVKTILARELVDKD